MTDLEIVQLVDVRFDKLETKIDLLSKEVKELSIWRWQVYGGAAAISFLVGLAVEVFAK